MDDGERHAEAAIEAQEQITRLEERIKTLKAERDGHLAEAIRAGIRTYNGWNIYPRSAPREADFGALVAYDADLADDFTDWYREQTPIKTTVTNLQDWLASREIPKEEADTILGAVLRDSGKEATVAMSKMKTSQAGAGE